MLELGIFHGGSVAFLALLAKPDRYVAIDRQPRSSTQFEEWVGSHDDVVHVFYGIDQADATALRGIVADEFADEPLDLVIDDASHLLDPNAFVLQCSVSASSARRRVRHRGLGT